MGMFDTIYFAEPITCSVCQAPIASTQTKAFECLLDDFYIGDCVGHAEEIRIVREGLYCNACHAIAQQIVYLVVYRGILVDIVHDLSAAEAQLRTFSFERLILWYHDQYGKRMEEVRERQAVERFLYDVVRWFGEGYHEMSPEELDKYRLLFFLNQDLLESTADPLTAIRAYLAERDVNAEAEP